jgi:hypothetical protein
MRKALTSLLKTAISISIIFTSLQLLVRLYNVFILNQVLAGKDSYRGNLQFILEELKIENILTYVIVIVFILTLSLWLYIMYREAHKESDLKMSYKPIWAMFSFIIPIFNFIAPYRIMNDLWVVYNKDMSIEKWGRNQVKIWWILSIVLFVLDRYMRIKFREVADLNEYLSLECFSIVILAVSIHYYYLLYRLVRLLTH